VLLLLLQFKRLTKNNFFTEKNPTLVTFPVKALDLREALPVPNGVLVVMLFHVCYQYHMWGLQYSSTSVGLCWGSVCWCCAGGALLPTWSADCELYENKPKSDDGALWQQQQQQE
jgi:hypothetical protein